MEFDLSGFQFDEFEDAFTEEPSGEPSLFQLISDALTPEGELPRDYHIPCAEDSVSFVDGARDAILLYHSAKLNAISPQQSGLLRSITDALSQQKFAEAMNAVNTLTKGSTVLPLRSAVHEHMMRYIGTCAAGTSGIPFEESGTQELMYECLNGKNAETVKFGLVLCELNPIETRIPKEMIRVLGLCNEFTLFALYNMQNWINANEEIFTLGRHVHGWGRIHAVEMISPRTEQIRTWLLMHGCHNDIMPQYSALAVYEKTMCRKLLTQPVSDRQLSEIAYLLSALLAEGVTAGISVIPDADAMLRDFIGQSRRRSLTLGICELVLAIRLNRADEGLRDLCDDLLHSKPCTELVRRAQEKGKAQRLADYLAKE